MASKPHIFSTKRGWKRIWLVIACIYALFRRPSSLTVAQTKWAFNTYHKKLKSRWRFLEVNITMPSRKRNSWSQSGPEGLFVDCYSRTWCRSEYRRGWTRYYLLYRRRFPWWRQVVHDGLRFEQLSWAWCSLSHKSWDESMTSLPPFSQSGLCLLSDQPT